MAGFGWAWAPPLSTSEKIGTRLQSDANLTAFSLAWGGISISAIVCGGLVIRETTEAEATTKDAYRYQPRIKLCPLTRSINQLVSRRRSNNYWVCRSLRAIIFPPPKATLQILMTLSC